MPQSTSIFPTRMYVLILATAGLLPPIFFTLFGWANGMYEHAHSNAWVGGVADTVISIFYTVLIGLPVIRYIEWLRVKMPWEKGVARRLLVEIGGSSILAGTIMLVLAWLVHLLVYPYLKGYSSHAELMFPSIVNGVLVALIMNGLLAMAFEGMVFFKDLQEAKFKAERLERERLQSQLEILKNQLKPHFLFNSLNVLSSLIHLDVDKSEEFIAQFSRVYRYVLDTYQQSLVAVERELGFIRSYLFLQEIRFGKGLVLTISDEELPADAFLPPMSLQLVLENAFKHNELSEEVPLNIEVIVNAHEVLIRNGFLPRKVGQVSTGIGQENLRLRYRLMEHTEPTFRQVENWYEARLPLIFDPT